MRNEKKSVKNRNVSDREKEREGEAPLPAPLSHASWLLCEAKLMLVVNGTLYAKCKKRK